MAIPHIAHVGYHRTGTNFLQKQVFPRLEDYIFRPSGSGWRFFDDREAFDEATARAYYESEQQKNVAGKPFLISHERLTGTEQADDLAAPAKLHRLNPDMRIIVVVRSQYDMFRSLYHLHVKRGGSDRYPDFVRRLAAGRRCDYHAMVARLVELFGSDAVLTLLYEDLARAPESFLAELCGFLEAPLPGPLPGKAVNARSSDSSLRLRRYLNEGRASGDEPPAWRSALRGLGLALAHKADSLSAELGGRAIAPIDTEAERSFIRDSYAESNRRLAELIGRPLGAHRYPL